MTFQSIFNAQKPTPFFIKLTFINPANVFRISIKVRKQQPIHSLQPILKRVK